VVCGKIFLLDVLRAKVHSLHCRDVPKAVSREGNIKNHSEEPGHPQKT